jgi:hypothetical protein
MPAQRQLQQQQVEEGDAAGAPAQNAASPAHAATAAGQPQSPASDNSSGDGVAKPLLGAFAAAAEAAAAALAASTTDDDDEDDAQHEVAAPHATEQQQQQQALSPQQHTARSPQPLGSEVTLQPLLARAAGSDSPQQQLLQQQLLQEQQEQQQQQEEQQGWQKAQQLPPRGGGSTGATPLQGAWAAAAAVAPAEASAASAAAHAAPCGRPQEDQQQHGDAPGACISGPDWQQLSGMLSSAGFGPLQLRVMQAAPGAAAGGAAADAPLPGPDTQALHDSLVKVRPLGCVGVLACSRC